MFEAEDNMGRRNMQKCLTMTRKKKKKMYYLLTIDNNLL